MTRSREAFFDGALEAGSCITVDKPPPLWLQALSARIFGFNTSGAEVDTAVVDAAMG